MDRLIHEFTARARDGDGHVYRARAFGEERADGSWIGWLEFTPVGGGIMRRSDRETTQPSRGAVRYWALGLDEVFLDGALARAMRSSRLPSAPSQVDSPASSD
ncbi:MAG TPA: hypothetical protein VJQ09_05500 [Candidatus Limnocylindria bacterium]|nr:hypothetical protein [Candidatus Limnocylindria bacterium]